MEQPGIEKGVPAHGTGWNGKKFKVSSHPTTRGFDDMPTQKDGTMILLLLVLQCSRPALCPKLHIVAFLFTCLSLFFTKSRAALPCSDLISSLHQHIKADRILTKYFSLKEWSGIGVSCPRRGWSHPLWKCSRDAWMWHLGCGYGVVEVVLG